LDAAARGASGGPTVQLEPAVGAGFKALTGATSDCGAPSFRLAREEWAKNFLTEVEAGVASEMQCAEGARVFNFLAVVPRAENEEKLVVSRVFGLESFVESGSAIDIFLVPKAVHQHLWDTLRAVGRRGFCPSLAAATRSRSWDAREFSSRNLIAPCRADGRVRGGACAQIEVVIVVDTGPPFLFVLARGFLLVDVGHVLFAESSVVEPVVAHPTVDHGVHGHGDFEGGCGLTRAMSGRKPS